MKGVIQKKGVFRLVIHLVSWLGFFLLIELTAPFPIHSLPLSVHLGLLLIILILLPIYYFNTLFLVPRLLYRKKYFLYIGALAGLIVVIVFINELFDHLTGFTDLLIQLEQTYTEPLDPDEIEYFIVDFAFVVLLMGVIFTLWSKHNQQEKEKIVLEKEKLTAELAFLKNQINPHFFFNTLNTIYSMIGRQPEEAREGVHLLSKMMRYLLYESDKDRVAVNDEIEFLEEFINLARMRVHKDVQIQFDCTAIFSDKEQIPPLLFLPFIENALKHGVLYESKSKITIRLNRSGNQIYFHVSNPVEPKKTPLEQGGIGLANINKRLALLYTDSAYNLTIDDTPQRFTVDLMVTLDD